MNNAIAFAKGPATPSAVPLGSEPINPKFEFENLKLKFENLSARNNQPRPCMLLRV